MAFTQEGKKIMDKVVAAIRFQELDSATASDLDFLTAHNKTKEEAKHHVISMALAAGGRQIGEHEADLIIEVPLEQAEVIRDIHSRLENDLEVSTTIGVGDELKDAKKALDWAAEHRPGTIKVLEPFIDQEVATSDDEEDYDYFSPQEVAISKENKPQHIKKSEDEPDDWADEKEAISDEMKQKIANIVQMLRDKREYLESLKESSPELYAGVLGLVQSISLMAQQAKQQDTDKHSKMIEKVANHLESAENDNLEQEAASVLEMLIEAQKEQDAEKEMKRQATVRRQKYLRKLHTDRAEGTAKKHGLDKHFLAHLLK